MKFKSIFHPFQSFNIWIYRKYHQNGTWNKLIETNPKRALQLEWRHAFHTRLNLKDPKTLNEKIQWLEVYSDTSLWTKYTDKYEVRKYVEKCGYKDYLLDLYGIWEDTTSIDYDSLPNSFAIKCTHDCGSTIIIRDKTKDLDEKFVNQLLNNHLKKPYGYDTCEPHYYKIPRRIIAEKLLPQSNLKISNIICSSTVDYKIWCIEGKAQFVLVCYDRNIGKNVTIEVYGINPWQPLRSYLSQKYQKQHFKSIPEPSNLKDMIIMAENLSTNFHQVRIDLYNIDGKIYFGEMTFTSACGRMDYFSDEVQLMMGQKIHLPPKQR